MRRQPAFFLLAALLLGGCTATEEPSEVLVMTSLSFAREEPEGVSVGFDLDGRASDETDSQGCGIPDYTSPAGHTGIDNSFAPVLPALENVGGAALEPLIQNSIDSGELLIMLERDPTADENGCIPLHILRGSGPPAIGTDGSILPGQTYERNLDAPGSDIECAVLEDGVLRAEPFSLRLPLSIFDESIDITMLDGILELHLGEEEASWGTFAGGVETQELKDNVNLLDGIGEEIPPLIDTVLDVRADLSPVGGLCKQISVTFEFDAVSAYLFDEEDAG